jgi:hypothetical protein
MGQQKSCGQCGLVEPHEDEGFEGDSFDSVLPHKWDGENLTIIPEQPACDSGFVGTHTHLTYPWECWTNS